MCVCECLRVFRSLHIQSSTNIYVKVQKNNERLQPNITTHIKRDNYAIMHSTKIIVWRWSREVMMCWCLFIYKKEKYLEIFGTFYPKKYTGNFTA